MNMNSGTKNLNIPVEDGSNENLENTSDDTSNEKLLDYQNDGFINLDDALDDLEQEIGVIKDAALALS